MRANVWGKTADCVRHLYPERQIYFRANGAVRFFVLKPGVQMTATVFAFVAAAWVGVASANLLLEDQIIAAKDRRIEEIADAYRTLDGEMTEMRQGVLATTADLETRQRFLNKLVLDQQNQEPPEAPVPDTLSTAPDAPAAETGRADRTSGLASRIGDVAAVMFSTNPPPLHDTAEIRAEAGQIALRLARIDESQRDLTARLLARTVANLDEIEGMIRVAGLTGDRILDAVELPKGGQGGPFVIDAENPAAVAALKTVGDEDFQKLVSQIQRLEGLRAAIKSLPLGQPAGHYYVSSVFGTRTDPFNKRRAMHAAIDLSGPWKEPIRATAPGIITRAGRNGPYGQFIEIDHGHGFKTRYGHMNKILVTKGQEVVLGDRIGLMGNTGRATSTHVHYEIWFEGTPRNPAKFFKAAQYVQQQQTTD